MSVACERGRVVHMSLAVSGGLYLAALASPALVWHPGFLGGAKSGAVCLALGWTTVGRLVPAWLANPVLALAVLCLTLERATAALTLALVALGLGLTTFRLYQVDPDFAHPHIGCYLWLASMLAVAVGAAARVARSER